MFAERSITEACISIACFVHTVARRLLSVEELLAGLEDTESGSEVGVGQGGAALTPLTEILMTF